MKMSKKSCCCDMCFHEIGKRNGSAAIFWLDLCELAMKKGDLFRLGVCDGAHVHTLESMLFITTTEQPGNIVFRMNGACLDKNSNKYYCIGGRKHAEYMQ